MQEADLLPNDFAPNQLVGAGAALQSLSSSGDLLIEAPTGETATLPAEAADGIGVVTADGAEVSMGLPDEYVDSSAVLPEDATIIYSGDEGVSLASQAVPDGVRAMVMVEEGTAPTNYAFDFELPADSRLYTNEDGSGELTRVIADGVEVGYGVVEAPWAIDANGDPVPTHYELNGTTLTQVIEHQGAAYPVIADPQWTWGNITGTLYFTRRETLKATTASGLVSIVAGLCAASAVTGPFAAALCAGISAHSAVIAVMASQYYDQGKCLKIKVPTFQPGSVQRGSRNCK